MSSEQGSEMRGETTARDAEQRIIETRPDRDAARADPENWPHLDLNRIPDAGRYFPEPRAWDTETPGETGSRATQRTADASAPGTTDQGRIAVVFTENTDTGATGHRDLTWSHPGAQSNEHLPPGSQQPAKSEIRTRDTEDVRDALLAGRSASDVRRAVTDQAPDPEPEPTTELVREDDEGRRYQAGTPQNQGDSFGERTTNEQGEASTKAELAERKRDARIEAAENLLDSIDRNADRIQKIVIDDRPPGPLESRTAQRVPDYTQPQGQQPSAGDLFSLGIVSYVMASKLYEKVGGRYLEWYWRDNGKGE